MAFNSGASSGNLVLIQSQTASNSSSINFTTGVTGYDIYYLSFYGVTIQTDGQALLLRFSTDGGSSYSATGYTNEGYLAYTGGLIQRKDLSTVGCTLTDNMHNSTTNPTSGNAQIYNLANTSFNKTCTAYAGFDVSTEIAQSKFENLWATTTAVNALRVIATSGNIVSGTFKLFGIQN